MTIDIITGDFKDIMLEMEEGSVDTIITSPPYKKRDGYTPNMMRAFAGLSYRVLKDGGLAFINVGALAECPSLQFDTHHFFMDQESNQYLNGQFTFVQQIVWVKGRVEDDQIQGHYAPLNTDRWLARRHESILVFAKGDYTLNKLSIGIPYKDKSNIDRFNHGRDIRDRGDVWYIPYKTITNRSQRRHENPFPVEVPLWCMRLAGSKTNKDLIVLDPFNGSGTTLIAALIDEVRATGIEILPEKVEEARDYISWYSAEYL